MNNIFTLLFCCAGLQVAVAQSLQLPEFQAIEKPIDATVFGMGGGDNDTLGLYDFLYATPSVFVLPETGYATGTLLSVDTFDVPGFGEVEATTKYNSFAEGHFVDDPYTVLGAMFFLGALDNASGDSTTEVTVNLHLIEDNMAISNPATVQAPDIAGPGQVLDATAVAFSQLVDTANGGFAPNFVHFVNEPMVDSDIAVALEISGVYNVNPNDTVALVSTANGEGDGEYTFHLVNQVITGLGGASIWSPTSAVIADQGGSGLDINFALFPIVTEFVGVEEAGFFDGIKTSIYPNPIRTSDQLNIFLQLENHAEKVSMNLYSLDGKRMMTTVLNEIGQAQLNIPIDVKLPAGTYVYSIQADDHRVAKRFIVTD